MGIQRILTQFPCNASERMGVVGKCDCREIPFLATPHNQSMLQQILFALALTILTVVLHAAGSVLIVIPATGVWKQVKKSSAVIRPVWILIRLVSLLLILHLVEMAVWAGAYAAGGVLPDFETALYFSMTSYTTVGFGDVIPSVGWRLLGPIEAAVGILMLGWSTGIIVAVVQRMYSARLPNAP